MDLPFEIRRQIWCLNFPDPRIYRARTSLNDTWDILWSIIEPIEFEEDDRYGLKEWDLRDRRDKDSARWMDLQLICPEASKVFHEVYIRIELKGSPIAKLWDTSAADQRSDFRGILTIQSQHTFFNKLADTLFLMPETMPTLLESWSWLDLSQIRHLAIEVDKVSNQHTKTWEMIAEAQSIKSLTLVVSRCTPSQLETANSYQMVDLESLSNARIAMCWNKRYMTTPPVPRDTLYQQLKSYSQLAEELKNQLFRDRPSTGQGATADLKSCPFDVIAAAVGALWQDD